MGSEDVKCLPIPLSHGLSHSLKIACTQIFLVTFLLSGSTSPSLHGAPALRGRGRRIGKHLGPERYLVDHKVANYIPRKLAKVRLCCQTLHHFPC